MITGNEVMDAFVWTVGGTGIVSLVFFLLRFIVMKISRDATVVVGDSAQRGQITDLRDEIKRLEEIIKSQNTSIVAMQREVMKLRFAFIDEQAALLRILNEIGHIDDPAVKARISAEIQAANQRRLAVMGIDDDSCKASATCQTMQ